jgi:hypothetical protein
VAGEKHRLTFSQNFSLCFWLTVFLVILCVVPAKADGSRPFLVIINSYHYGYEWSDQELAGLLNKLRQVHPLLDPAVEYLDAKRYPGRDQIERMKGYLAGKYQGRKTDLVVVLDNPALEMVIDYRQELFPGVPLVFAGINDYHPAKLKGREKVTGVAEVQNIAGTLDLALSLHPDAKEVLAIVDSTASGTAGRRDMEMILPAFENRVKVNFTPPATFQEVRDHLNSLPSKSLALLVSFTTDRNLVSFSAQEATRLLSADSPVPVYSLNAPRLGHGIVGGILLGGWDHGHRAGEIALKVLAGEDPARIPMQPQFRSRHGSSSFLMDVYQGFIRAFHLRLEVKKPVLQDHGQGQKQAVNTLQVLQADFHDHQDGQFIEKPSCLQQGLQFLDRVSGHSRSPS